MPFPTFNPQFPVTAEGATAETRERTGGMLAHAREAVSGAVHTAEDKAKWAVQHTKGEWSFMLGG